MAVAPRRALYGRMAGDTTLNNLLGAPADDYAKAIYYEVAPEGAAFPYVIFSKVSGTPRYALKALGYDNEIWMVKGVDRSDDSDPVETIATRLDALLTDATLSISGKTHLYLRRESDVDYAEVTDGVRYLHAGANFRFMYA